MTEQDLTVVPIQVYIKGVPQVKGVDLGWGLGLWYYDSQPERKIWGLTYDMLRSQMSYGLDYAKPKEAILRRRENFKTDPDVDWHRWYFDVGRKLYVELSELEDCCKQLGIWDEAPETV